MANKFKDARHKFRKSNAVLSGQGKAAESQGHCESGATGRRSLLLLVWLDFVAFEAPVDRQLQKNSPKKPEAETTSESNRSSGLKETSSGTRLVVESHLFRITQEGGLLTAAMAGNQ